MKRLQVSCARWQRKVYTVELPNKARSLSAGKLADCARKYCEEAEAKDSIQSAVESATAACGAGNE